MKAWAISVASTAVTAALFYFGIVQGVPGALNLLLFIEWFAALAMIAISLPFLLTGRQVTPVDISFPLRVFRFTAFAVFAALLAWFGFIWLATAKSFAIALFNFIARKSGPEGK